MSLPPGPPPTAARRPGSWCRRALPALLVVLLTVTGCGLRLDSAPPPPPPPDAVESVRQEAARGAVRLQRAAEAAAPEDEAVGAALAEVAETSAAHAESLGGVWEAWPDGVPAGTDHTPSPAPAVPGAGTAEAVLAELVASTEAAREQALTVPDADLAALLGSVVVRRTWAAVDLARALELEPGVSAGAPYPVPALQAWQMDSRTVEALDAARYTYEVVGARSEAERRERAARRAEELRPLAEAAATQAAQDPRRGAYPVPGDGSAAAAAEERVLRQWVFRVSVAPRDARPELIEAAVHTAGELRAWGGTLPPLPGIG
ncbi:DUF4439 domain-containing protein [Georgenia sp. 10Sc9-8]|uniref:DUF4439 domain-containing protein n=1 Tax=Georgenia halotolerans TaxID=3028317 RepID=A0ABT5U1S9_9MICO|nr:DUF4439 domain-containing protein [Georgenia halotolerans]